MAYKVKKIKSVCYGANVEKIKIKKRNDYILENDNTKYLLVCKKCGEQEERSD